MSDYKKSEFQEKVQKLLSGEDTSIKRSRRSEDSTEDIKEYLKGLHDKVDFVMKQNKQNNENVTLLIEENKKTGKALEFLSKRIETLEKKIDNDIATSTRNSDEEFLKDVVKRGAKMAFSISVYPTKDELRYVMEQYIKAHHQSFYDKFEDASRWNSFYNSKLSSDLHSKVRSLRGGLASKAKEVLFSHFGDSSLPLINNSASATEITQWKRKREVTECYKRVFDSENKKSSVLSQLLEKVFIGEDNPSNIHMAFVVALYKVLLDPNSQNIQVSESTMKIKMEEYMTHMTGCNASRNFHTIDD